MRERDSAAAQRALAAMPTDGVVATMKTFRFLTVGARALLPGSAAISRQPAPSLLVPEKNSSEAWATNPTTRRRLCALGVVDAALGNKEDAIREGERAVELMPVSKSAIEGPVLIAIPGCHLCVDGRKRPCD